MQASRPVVAFALLRQCSELMRTDLLSGIAVLMKPLIADLADQVFDSRVLADRLAKAYGISIPAQALDAMTQRLVSANLLRLEQTDTGVPKALYCPTDDVTVIEPDVEKDFQEILDDFLSHAKKLLKSANKTQTDETLISGFLRHLATLDFSAIRAKPVVQSEPEKTILGPAAREQQQVSAELAEQAVLDSLVASYIAWLQEHNEPRLMLLAKVADGALGAELVFDLQAPTSVTPMTNTTVIVDTPLLLSFLDLSSTQDTADVRKLFEQIKGTGAKIAAFQHSVEEAEGVLKAIQNARGYGEAYGPSVHRLSNSTFRAYFESMMGSIAKSWVQLHHLEIIQEASTHFHVHFSQIEEDALIGSLRLSPIDRVLTRERDAKSVAETMRRLAGGHIPIGSISSCRFIFATPNAALQRRVARFLHEKNYVQEGEFNPIVTSRYLSGLCWLVCGGKADQSPTVARLLANCAAALRLKPELAERTKRFLAAVDPEKARHFEALMTNERASQYLAEATLGDANVITANNVEDIFEEVQRRAAEKVAQEKDIEYRGKMSALEAQVQEAARSASELQDTLINAQLDVDARKMEVRDLQDRAQRLETERDEERQRQKHQSEEIARLEIATAEASSTVDKVRKQLDEQLQRGERSAARYADKLVKLIRVTGVIGLFSLAAIVGYLDKFWIPSLSNEQQTYANVGVIVLQATMGLFGVALLFDPIVKLPLARLRERLFRYRLEELGFVLASEPGTEPIIDHSDQGKSVADTRQVP